MKTKKVKVIEAIKRLINDRYGPHYVYGNIFCPLCPIFHGDLKLYQTENCIGCPNFIFRNNVSSGELPCKGSHTFMIYMNNIRPMSKITIKSYRRPRLNFWKQALKILSELPAKVFTFKGYDDKYFTKLLDIDQKEYRKYYNIKL